LGSATAGDLASPSTATSYGFQNSFAHMNDAFATGLEMDMPESSYQGAERNDSRKGTRKHGVKGKNIFPLS